MKKRLISLTALWLSAVIIFSSCSAGTSHATLKATKLSDTADKIIKAGNPRKSPAEAQKRNDTFVASINEPGGVFLPYFYDNGWDGNAVQPIFASLIDLDKSGKPIPNLASSWKVSSDGLTYTYFLRPNLKFSDGSSLTADDVAFTLTLLDDPAYSSGVVDISTAHIKGADEYKYGSAASISGITVINSTTIQIATDKVNPLNLTLLGCQVLSKAYYGRGYQKGKLDYLKDLYSKPLGSGPYKLDQYITGQEIRYTANPYYYAGKPAIGHLIFKITSRDTALQLFQTGQTDYDSFSTDSDTLEQLKNLGFANIRIGTVSDYGEIYINNKKPYLKDTAVRKALIYGLNRQYIIDVKYKGYGQVANVFTAPTIWSYTEDGVTKYNYDPEKAKKLLDSDGWKAGPDGIREKNGQKLRLYYLTTKADDQVIPIAKDNYQKIGIDFEAEVLDSNTLFSKLSRSDYDLCGVRTNGLADPDDSVEEYSSTDPNVNVSGYTNQTAAGLIKEGISTTDLAKRKQIYRKLYQVLSNDPPVILLDYRKSISAWNDRIAGGDNFETGASDVDIQLAKLKIR